MAILQRHPTLGRSAFHYIWRRGWQHLPRTAAAVMTPHWMTLSLRCAQLKLHCTLNSGGKGVTQHTRGRWQHGNIFYWIFSFRGFVYYEFHYYGEHGWHHAEQCQNMLFMKYAYRNMRFRCEDNWNWIFLGLQWTRYYNNSLKSPCLQRISLQLTNLSIIII